MSHKLFYLLHTAHHKLFSQADKICLDQLGVTSVQLSALFFLSKHDGCQAKELGKGLSLNNSAITGLLNRLNNLGLIKKTTSSADARATQIFLTEKALIIIPQGLTLVKHLNQALAQSFSEAELDTVARFLSTLTKLEGETLLPVKNQK